MQQALSLKPTRREFLNYVWGASMALVLAQTGGIAFWFALPRPRATTKIFSIAELPLPNEKPLSARTENAGFHLTHSERGIAAFDNHCTHHRCVFPWAEAAGIFSCPCHGSQFNLNGDYIAGPAPRALDRYGFEVWDAQGKTIAASSQGQPLPLPDNAAFVRVKTDRLFQGKWHFAPATFPEGVPTVMPDSLPHEH